MCRVCAYRFSEHKSNVRNRSNIETSKYALPAEAGTENLLKAIALTETETRQEVAPRESTTNNPDVKGKVVDHLWWLKQEGYSETTILGRSQILRFMEKSQVDLMNPEAVRDYIAKQNWTPGRRANIIYAYALFAKWAGLKFILPRINIPEKLPFIPTEREIDDLIAASSKYIGTFLQLCKETGARSGEIARLKWTDVDYEGSTIRISPEKRSNPRLCKTIEQSNADAKPNSKSFSHSIHRTLQEPLQPASLVRKAKTSDRRKNGKPTITADTLSHAQTLERHYGIRQDQGHTSRHASTGAQANSEHPEIYPTRTI